MTRSIPRPDRPAPRVLPAVVAAALLGVVVVAGLAGQLSGRDDDAAADDASPAPVVVGRTTHDRRRRRPPPPPSTAPATDGAGEVVARPRHRQGHVRRRRADGAAAAEGPRLRAGPDRRRSSATSPAPRCGPSRSSCSARHAPRPPARSPTRCGSGCRTRSPSPRAGPAHGRPHRGVPARAGRRVLRRDDRPALISHMSSGTGEQWCEEVTISPGEIGNEHGTDAAAARASAACRPRPAACTATTGGSTGVRQSALGGMWNPVYFNYGIAIHGALNVPLQPASHGCIRIPLAISETFQQLVGDRDRVYVFDGKREPEAYGAQKPRVQLERPRLRPRRPTPTPAPGRRRAAQPGSSSTRRPVTRSRRSLRSLAAYSSRPISAPGARRRRTRRSASAAPRRAPTRRGRWWLRSRPMATRRMPASVRTRCLVVGVEGGELGVRRLRLALAVVAGDLGDDLDLEVGQPGQLAVADHVVGVQVVLAVGDDEADVGQQGAGLEVLAGRAVEVVQRLQARRTARRRGGRRGPSGPGRRRSARRAGGCCAGTRRAGGAGRGRSAAGGRVERARACRRARRRAAPPR